MNHTVTYHKLLKEVLNKVSLRDELFGGNLDLLLAEFVTDVDSINNFVFSVLSCAWEGEDEVVFDSI